MKFLLSFILISTTSLFGSFSYECSQQKLIYLSSHPTIQCSQEFHPLLQTIQKLPKAQTLIYNILQEGPLLINSNHYYSTAFEGYWDLENRTIYLTCPATEGQLITTLLFEMHNALRTKDLQKLGSLASSCKIDRASYIEAVEYIEYENALATANLINEGIALGLFPPESYWPLHPSFQEHLSYQKLVGHSNWIGEVHDQLSNECAQ